MPDEKTFPFRVNFLFGCQWFFQVAFPSKSSRNNFEKDFKLWSLGFMKIGFILDGWTVQLEPIAIEIKVWYDISISITVNVWHSKMKPFQLTNLHCHNSDRVSIGQNRIITSSFLFWKGSKYQTYLQSLALCFIQKGDYV